MTPLRDFSQLRSFLLRGCQILFLSVRDAKLRARAGGMHNCLPRAFVRWCMCEHAPSISLPGFCTPPPGARDIKTLAGTTGLANVCAGTEHLNAGKVGQESATRMFCSLA